MYSRANFPNTQTNRTHVLQKGVSASFYNQQLNFPENSRSPVAKLRLARASRLRRLHLDFLRALVRNIHRDRLVQIGKHVCFACCFHQYISPEHMSPATLPANFQLASWMHYLFALFVLQYYFMPSWEFCLFVLLCGRNQFPLRKAFRIKT